MSYRVETALSARAGCQATECKAAGIKIDKDELRLGVWVEYDERGSWTWRHWGCVTGRQIQNIRNNLEDPNHPGVYRWDFLDGYEGDEKNSLDKHPDLQEKVRRVITQGFIDPDDWNGDPEMNKLGESGMRTAESKKRMREEKKNREHEINELKEKLVAAEAERDALKQGSGSAKKLEAQVDAIKGELEGAGQKKPVGKKRVKPDSADDEEEKKPAKKKRVSKAKKTVKQEDDEEEEEVIPAKKSRAKKAVKKEKDADDEDVLDAPGDIPVAKRANRGKKVKEEATDEDEASEAKPKAPAKKARGKKVVKEEPIDEDETAEVKKAPVKKGRSKKTVKKEDVEEATTNGVKNSMHGLKEAPSEPAVKGEPMEGVTSIGDVPLAIPNDIEEDAQSAAALAGSFGSIIEDDAAKDSKIAPGGDALKAETEDSQTKKDKKRGTASRGTASRRSSRNKSA